MPDKCDKFFEIDGQAILITVLIVFVVPFQWVFGWTIAAVIHELGHILALYLCGIRICAIRIGINGTKIITAPMMMLQEAMCTIAGPLVGLCTFFLAKELPYVAISGFLQSCYNLLPVYPLDGGRTLRCLLQGFLPESSANKLSTIISFMVLVASVAIGICLSAIYSHCFLLILFPAMPLLLTIWKNTLQRGKKNSTIHRRKKLRGNRNDFFTAKSTSASTKTGKIHRW